MANEPDDPNEPPSVPRDHLTYLHYTLFPTLYTDESSDVNDLLWQLVLEARGARYWLAVLTTLLAAVAVVVAIAVVAS